MAASSLVLLIAGAVGNLATVEAAGQSHTANLFAGPIALVEDGLWELAIPVVFASIAAPLAVVCLQLYVLGGLLVPRPPRGIRWAFRLQSRLRPWAMIDVFIVGYFVAYSKLGALVRIEPDTGFYALFAFMLATIAADVLIDPQSVWAAIDRRDPMQQPRAAARATGPGRTVLACETCGLACLDGTGTACPRCFAAMHRRKSQSVARTAALALAGLVFYLPANLYPALTVIQLGSGSPSTILGGVWQLAAASEWPLAIIVFLASAAVPVCKLLGLGAMVFAALHGGSRHSREMTVLYRVLLAIGRWSMIDVFMESILGSLVQFGAIATIKPGGGAIAFAAVVVLTMLAAEAFDPRLMWDKAPR